MADLFNNMLLKGVLVSSLAGIAPAGPPSIETFAARAEVEDATLSPDGRYIATVQTHAGRAGVLVRELVNGEIQSAHGVLGEPEHFQIRWCRFATNTRLLCGFLACRLCG